MGYDRLLPNYQPFTNCGWVLINRKSLSSQKDQLILNQSVFSVANDHLVIFPEKNKKSPISIHGKKNIQYPLVN